MEDGQDQVSWCHEGSRVSSETQETRTAVPETRGILLQNLDVTLQAFPGQGHA
jgi:hypothetical protein